VIGVPVVRVGCQDDGRSDLPDQIDDCIPMRRISAQLTVGEANVEPSGQAQYVGGPVSLRRPLLGGASSGPVPCCEVGHPGAQPRTCGLGQDAAASDLGIVGVRPHG
jgi:hypothetical protein